jgi:aerobic-type carbon monoxide dehydrogenase small subunit (CoxS/CutS family)
MLIELNVNGKAERIDCRPDMRLIEILRERLGLMAAKLSCGIGRCGACTVLVDDEPLNACLLMAFQLDGRRITTPEGLDARPVAQVARAAMTAEVSFQCGYCASGIITSLTHLLEREPAAGEDQVRRALSGHICRCTGYQSIIRGALRAAKTLSGQTAQELS